MTFRSLQMSHYQLIIPRQGVWDAINQLGQIELAHVLDSGDPINRPFFNQLKRCDESLQKITFLCNALKDAKMEIVEFDQNQDKFFENLQQVWKDEAKMYGIEQSKLIDKFENEVMEQWQRYQDISMRIQKLKQGKKLILQKIASIEAVQSIYQAKDDPLDERNYQNNIQGRLKGFSFIVGVVQQQSESRLTRMIYRVSMGYAFMKTVDEFKMKDLRSFKQKVVLVIYPNSDTAVLQRKIKRVMQTFCVNNFIITQQQLNVKGQKDRLVRQYEQVTNLLNLNQAQMKSFLDRIKSVYNIQNWRIYFWKERYLYSILDKMQVRQQFFRANIYVPSQSAAKLSLQLNKLVPSPSLLQIPLANPPTAFKVTQYTSIAQQITNTYGVPRYQQINPTIFTVVTFPFFFGVMFGDIAHGAILLAFGLFLIFNQEKIKKSSMKVFVSLKYMITMMGFFSFYCGWIYNDFIGMNINIFGSCYNPPAKVQPGEDKQDFIAKSIYPIKDCVYPIGVDPVWGRATNELVYINALKMKISVIIAIIHMTLGVCIKAFNSVYFKKRLDFYFQFIPQVIFLVLLFGYMDFLIIFKWFKQQQWLRQAGDTKKAPSIISTMMNIGLKIGKTSINYDGNSNMWGQTGNTSQDTIQLFILIISFLCIPLMLLPKPLIEINKIKKHKAKHPLQGPSMQQLQNEMQMQRKLIPNKKQVSNEIEKHEQPSQIFVHQLIQTIQYVLGAVSNTASYLRLWALSLAHSQLAKVFFEKILVSGYELPITFAIPMFMDFIYYVGLLLEFQCVWIQCNVFYILYDYIGYSFRINFIKEMDINMNHFLFKILFQKINLNLIDNRYIQLIDNRYIQLINLSNYVLYIYKYIFKMEKRPIGYVPGKPSVLDKKIPKNQKYEHIESKLAGKTGTTIKDIEFMSNKQVSKKKGQLFLRIKPSTLWKLINQQTQTESIYNWNKPEQDAQSQTSNLTSITIKTQQLPVGIQTEFLLLDLRDQQEYQQYHIKQALSYPGPNINRDKILPQMYHYKNKEKKIIIAYHFDEKKGIQYAMQFAERGYQNIYLVSGGIEAFGQEIPEGLEGKSVPVFEKKQDVKKFKKKRLQ